MKRRPPVGLLFEMAKSIAECVRAGEDTVADALFELREVRSIMEGHLPDDTSYMVFLYDQHREPKTMLCYLAMACELALDYLEEKSKRGE